MTNYEDALIKYPTLKELEQQGWKITAGKTLCREKTEPLLISELKESVTRINRETPLQDTELSNLIEELRRKTASAKDCADILEYLRTGIPFKPKSKGSLEILQLLSPDVEENTYTAAYETTYSNSKDERIRCDIVLYINGIPLADIECKDPTNINLSWADAYQQIKRYQKTVPELYKYVQIGVAADVRIKYFPTTPWLLTKTGNKTEYTSEHSIEYSREEDKIDTAIKIAEWDEEKPLEIFTPSVFLNIIKNYTFNRITKGNDSKILPRFIQYRTVEKIVRRVKENIAGNDPKNKGLIWHWQGSGKTLTMEYAARRLYNLPELEKPTIFIVTDRDDLQTQLKSDYESVKGLPAVNKVTSIKHLTEILSADSLKGRREILTVLVQKFRPEKLRKLEEQLKASETETVSTRKNIILLIDEAHRTQEGILSGEMRNILLKNAFAFAFTGTPNTGDPNAGDKTKNTFTEFSYIPEEEYLDKYSMEESIKDGFTLPLTYKPCLSDADIQMYDAAIQAFLNQYFEDVDEAIKAIKEEAIKKQLKAYKLFLENPAHIKDVSEKIVKHYKKTVEPAGFKALLVCTSRKACVLYKEELDRLFGNSRTAEVVMTYEENEKDPAIAAFQKKQRELHPKKTEKEFTDAYRDNYKETDYPKILIVTDKLIAGFDFDLLQTIYLDKLVKGNKLLQTITRCNRPRDGKDYGLIIDFVGILRHISKALSNYSRGAFRDTIINKEELSASCAAAIINLKKYFGEIPCGNITEIDSAVKHLLCHPETWIQFKANFLRIRRIRRYVESGEEIVKTNDLFEWFERVYNTYTKLENGDVYKISEEEMTEIYLGVQENISPGYTKTDLPEKSIRLPEKTPTAPKGAVNIVFALEKFVLTDKSQHPVYESLYEKIKRKVSEWKAEKITDLEICQLYDEVICKTAEIQKAEKESDLTEIGFAIYMLIRETWGESQNLHREVKELDAELQTTFIQPDWRERPTAVKEAERKIKSLLRRYGKANGKTIDEIDDLFEKILTGLE